MADPWLLYIVVNTVSPYVDELPVILAYPRGCYYRARFKDEWVDSQMLDTLGELRNQPCIIVYRDFETAYLYPIRFGTVREINRYGDVVYIQYELGRIVPYPPTPEARAQQLHEFRQEWAADHAGTAKTNSPNSHMIPLVFKSKYFPKIGNRYLRGDDEYSHDFESWSNLCRQLANVTAYAGVEFLRILGVRVQRGDRIEALQPVKGQYRLRPRRSHELVVAQRFFHPPADIPPHRLEFRCEGIGLRSITGARRPMGKYDFLSFYFQTAATGSRVAGGVLSLVRTPNAGAGDELELLARVAFEVPILGLIGTVVGAVALLFPELATHIGVPMQYETLISRIGTLLFVIGVLDSRSILEYITGRSTD